MGQIVLRVMSCNFLSPFCFQFEYRKKYSDLFRRQQLRRLEHQRKQDHKLLLSSFIEDKELKNEISNINQNRHTNEIEPTSKDGIVDTRFLEKEESISVINDNGASLNLDYVNTKCEEQDKVKFWEKLDYYSIEQEENHVTEPLTLWEKVATWALKHYTNRQSINEILEIFRSEVHNDLLKDARTLLGIARKSSNIIPCCSGSYLHYGLERGISDILKITPNETIPETIFIDINIDGLPLCKSSKSQLWIISGKISVQMSF